LIRDRFEAAGIATAALDARLLAERAFGLDGVQLVANEREPMQPGGEKSLDAYATRRLAGEPVARILGEKEFYGLEFRLNAETLVPRPETELLVDLGLETIKSHKSPHILDLGTGSGCIPISLLVNCKNAHAVAIDINPKALEQAQENANLNGVADEIEFRQGSWFAPLDVDERFDLIVSNPPYIESEVIGSLDREVRLHDPVLALDGGFDGLAPYRIIASMALNHLQPGGAVIVEVGQGQAEIVAEMFVAAGFARREVHDDLAGVARAVLSIS